MNVNEFFDSFRRVHGVKVDGVIAPLLHLESEGLLAVGQNSKGRDALVLTLQRPLANGAGNPIAQLTFSVPNGEHKVFSGIGNPDANSKVVTYKLAASMVGFPEAKLKELDFGDLSALEAIVLPFSYF